MNKKISIALDGPAGAGKSTMARRVAGEMGFVYVDTGALYRTVGYHIRNCGADPTNETVVAQHLGDICVEIEYNDAGQQRMILNGKDVTDELRTPVMSDYASKTSALPCVRAFLLEQQRDLARRYNVVMDGRDIGTVVLPDAAVKIFLTASAEVRAKRRLLEFQAKGDTTSTLESVLSDMKQRDERDSQRATAPLKQAEDAVLLDTSELSIDESICAIKKIIRERTAR